MQNFSVQKKKTFNRFRVEEKIVIPAQDPQYSAVGFSVIFALLDEQSRVPALRPSQTLWVASQAVDKGATHQDSVPGKAPVSSSVLNKAGPKGKRVVHVLPSVGKQFFKVLLRTKRDMWSPPAPTDWLHGYIPRRRRESAVLIRQVTTWRLERLGMKSLTAFHDLTNAFGSVKWEDRAAARLLGPKCLLGQQRYRLATTTIPGMDGISRSKLGEGGLMGDPLMVALFWVAILPSTIRWQHAVADEGAESRQLLCMASLVGWKGHYHSMQDDTTKQIVAEPGEHVQALAKRVRCSNDVFDRALATDGFSQNTWKEELLMHLVGEGSFTDRRLVRDGKVSSPGKVVTVARHLSSHLGRKGILRSRAPKAEASHDDGFLLCWSVVVREQGVVEGQVVLLQWSCGQHSSIWNRGLFCPSKAQYQSLTSLVTCLARRVMAGAAAGRGDHVRVRTMSNKVALRFWKLAPCGVEARVRRLKWAQTYCLSVAQFAQPNLEIGQNSNSICETFSKMTDFEMPSWGKPQAGGGSARAGPSSGETGGGRRRKRPRSHSAPGGRAGDSVSGQRGRTERADCHRVQDVSGSRRENFLFRSHSRPIISSMNSRSSHRASQNWEGYVPE